MFDSNTVFVSGASKSQLNNPITYQYGRFILAFVVDRDSGRIITCSGSTTLELTNEFLQSIFCGKNMLSDDKLIQDEITNRYIGASQKAILVAYRDAQKRYKLHRQGDIKGATEFILS